MKLISLRTIAAMRLLAGEHDAQAKAARTSAYAAKGKPNADKIKEAEGFALVARELREIATQKAHERAFGTARWITGPNGLRPVEARAIAAAIEASPAFKEITAEDLLPGDRGVHYRVRLVYYYDPTTKTKRWALEYINDKDRPILSDNEEQADAEFRYQEFVKMFGLLDN